MPELHAAEATATHGIGIEAELQTWRDIRDQVRRRLTWSVTIAFLYLMAALAVGGFLLSTVAVICEDAVYLDGWETREFEMGWISAVAWFYAGLAIVAVIAFPLVLLFIAGKLPPELVRLLGAIPFVGSTVRSTSTADFCQSIYRSVLNSKTYGDAMATASTDVRDALFRRWSGESALALKQGHAMANVLATSPVWEQPIAALTALVGDELSVDATVRVWQLASTECHRLASSRMHRTIQCLSVSCLLVSVLIAAFAVLVSAYYASQSLQGFGSSFFWFGGF